MNTGFLGPAVTTVLTACGIETMKPFTASSVPFLLQQYLPLAVLKPAEVQAGSWEHLVATVLTACGIETHHGHDDTFLRT